MNLIKSLFTGAVLMAAAAVSLAEQPMPLPLGRDISASFTGTAHRNDLVIPETMGGVPQTNVITFEPGSRSGWHTHGAMTVIGIAGVGLYRQPYSGGCQPLARSDEEFPLPAVRGVRQDVESSRGA